MVPGKQLARGEPLTLGERRNGDPLGATISYAYDERGYLTAVTDALAHVCRVELDSGDIPTVVAHPLWVTPRYALDVVRSGRPSDGSVLSVAGGAGVSARTLRRRTLCRFLAVRGTGWAVLNYAGVGQSATG